MTATIAPPTCGVSSATYPHEQQNQLTTRPSSARPPGFFSLAVQNTAGRRAPHPDAHASCPGSPPRLREVSGVSIRGARSRVSRVWPAEGETCHGALRRRGYAEADARCADALIRIGVPGRNRVWTVRFQRRLRVVQAESGVLRLLRPPLGMTRRSSRDGSINLHGCYGL